MKKLFIAILVLCVLSVGAVIGWQAYKIWKQDHALTLARQYLAKSDFKNALLCVRQVLDSNPSNVEGVRLMADFAEASRSPNAPQWRARLVELEPASVTNRFNLVRTALSFGDAGLANHALQGIAESDRHTATYHKTAGAVAAANREMTNAMFHFQEAIRLEPTNAISRLNLAVLQLQNGNSNQAAQARQSIEQLRAAPEVRTEALRELARDALRSQQPNRALPLVDELLRETNSAFGDRFLRLDALRDAKSPQLPSALAALQREVATNSVLVHEVARWMLAWMPVRQEIAWLESLPPNIRTNQPLPFTFAESYAAAKDWPALQRLLDGQNWGELDFIRIMYRTRALREQNLQTAAKTEWNLTMKLAEGQPDRLGTLLQLATQWQWPVEQEDLLWKIVKRMPGNKEAVKALWMLLYQGGKTRSILTLYETVATLEPDNIEARNNLAAIALLLNASEHKPHDLARQVYEKEPGNIFYASTYAYSLYLQKKHPEGLKVMRAFKPEQLENPLVSGYYGLLLAANGDKAGARQYFELTTKVRQLPEEKELFRRAQL